MYFVCVLIDSFNYVLLLVGFLCILLVICLYSVNYGIWLSDILFNFYYEIG